MPLEPGARLGPYEVVQLLGAGGMGEVYKALDPRLGREVAIKVLAPSLAQDRDALARFEREAKATSALNHPHIVHIYEIGEAQTPSGAAHYIAMEFVEGETLRARFKGGARWGSLVEPLAQTADALAKAHKAGIVHRDLKPENVMITSDGYPKVVDFGLVKLIEASGPAAPAGPEPAPASEGRTRTGMIVGTPAYMSPEQVQGRPVDQRSDIFSFGCILYEAVTGHQPFRGDSSVATLHAIVYDKPPPVESLNADASPELRQIIEKCLAKDPGQRYQMIKDVGTGLRLLTRTAATPSQDSVPTTAITREAAGGGAPVRHWLAWSLAVAVVAVGVVVGSRLRAARDPSARRAPDRVIQVEKLTSRGDAWDAAISPDGRYLAYSSQEAGHWTIWLRDIGEKTEARLVGGIDAQFLNRFWFSKAGKAIYYSFLPRGSEHGVLYRVPLIGGEPRLVTTGTSGRGLSPDERRVAFTRTRDGKDVLIIADLESGGQKEISDAHGGPWSPDGTQLIFTRVADAKTALFVVKADGTAERRIIELPEEPTDVVWRPDGARLMYFLNNTEKDLQLFELDPATGGTRPIGEKRWHEIDEVYWLPDASGFVVHDWGKEALPAVWLVSYPDGKTERVPADSRAYEGLSMTADGTRLVTIQIAQRSDILVSSSPERGSFKKIASGTDVTHSLSWTPDGKIVYSSNEGGSDDLYVSDADGSNRKQLTFDRTSNEIEPAASLDGRYIVFVSNRSGERGLYRINRDGTGIKSLTSPTAEHEDREPQLTPDSQWVIYRHWDDGPTLWRVPIDGGSPVLIRGARPAAPPGPREYAFGASASADGSSVAFFYQTSDLAYDNWSPIDIAVSTRDGHILRRLPYVDPKTGIVKDGLRVQWGPNKALYYQAIEGSNLWMRPLAGGPPVQVTHFEERLQDFDWSFDGRSLACSRASQLRDVVLITNFH